MPDISTHVDRCGGHDTCRPRDFSEHSADVFAEGFEVAREGDTLKAHGCGAHPVHGAKVTRGYPSVTANGRRVAYVGALVDCASRAVDTGRPSVRLGEGAYLLSRKRPT